MTPFFSLALLAASLSGVLTAPIAPIHDTPVAALQTIYSGFGSPFERQPLHIKHQRVACPDIEYAMDEPAAALNPAQLGNVEDGTSVCGMYVKVNRHDSPEHQYTYRVVDVCNHCDDNSLELTKAAMLDFTNSEQVAVDWHLVHANDGITPEPTTVVEPTHKPQTTKTTASTTTTTTTTTTMTTTTTTTTRSHTTTTSAPKPTQKPSDENHSGTIYRGRGTWFSDNTGSCGEKFTQKDMIVAVNESQMGKMWGKGSQCGRRIRVKAKGYSGSVDVRVVDTCPRRYCQTGALDLSRAAFQKIAPLSVGVLSLEWSWI